MRALLDTNLILDLFLERPEFIRAAEELWEANRLGRFNGFVSALTPATVFYIGRKVKGEAAMRQALAGLLAKFEICAVDHATLQFALGLPLKDYEDAIQLASAVSYDLDAIITRDLDDYAGAGIPVFSPADFLKQLTPAQG